MGNKNWKHKKNEKRKFYTNTKPGTFKKRHSEHKKKPHKAEPLPPIPDDLEGAFDLLIPDLKRAIGTSGYITPTPIQEQAIPHLNEGRDLLGCAQTGTGKTAAFVLPILQFLDTERRKSISGSPFVLIMAPTRELSAQIGDSIEKYGKYISIRHTVVFGGVGAQPQKDAMARGVHILVATPGRLLDLIEQKKIFLDKVEVFVLDEADRMLDMGFLPDIRRVIAKLPEERQTLFFSATMAPEVVSLAKTLVRDPIHITIEPEKPAVESIIQKVYFVDQPNKVDLLIDLLKDSDMDRVIVFTKMKHRANIVAEKLQNADITAAAIHGNKSQGARTKALADFKSGQVRVMVATDIAARGIDVRNISHVINFDLSDEPEVYIHRIGRTARAGAEGDAISFCTADDLSLLRGIERLMRKPVPQILEHRYHSEKARLGQGAAPKKNPRRGSGRTRGPPRRSYRGRGKR